MNIQVRLLTKKERNILYRIQGQGTSPTVDELDYLSKQKETADLIRDGFVIFNALWEHYIITDLGAIAIFATTRMGFAPE